MLLNGILFVVIKTENVCVSIACMYLYLYIRRPRITWRHNANTSTSCLRNEQYTFVDSGSRTRRVHCTNGSNGWVLFPGPIDCDCSSWAIKSCPFCRGNPEINGGSLAEFDVPAREFSLRGKLRVQCHRTITIVERALRDVQGTCIIDALAALHVSPRYWASPKEKLDFTACKKQETIYYYR